MGVLKIYYNQQKVKQFINQSKIVKKDTFHVLNWTKTIINYFKLPFQDYFLLSKPEIYKYTNIQTNRIYIGEISNFIVRYATKLFRFGHANALLIKDYQKYGVDSFIW